MDRIPTHLQRLGGKVALVTGAGSGIGRGVALHFAAHGAVVLAAGRRRSKLAEIKKEIDSAGGACHVLRMDVESEQSVLGALGQLDEMRIEVDVIVNNAGVSGSIAPASDADIEGWMKVLRINLGGMMLVSKHFTAAMKRKMSGSIVNISSVGAKIGMESLTAYSASKAGVEGFTRSLALELAKYKIRVNAIEPALIMTEMTEPLIAGAASREKALEGFASKYPLGRIGTPLDIAKAALFFVSDDSEYITGAALNVDGGYLAGT
ncbi:MAG: SDR family oxidoreductase [Planctomycetes bacterium]|nr:SDR family oxidoreductase [Planctomycetota bacterium]